jgi:uncharacterized protein YqfB (UPF0267 family)
MSHPYRVVVSRTVERAVQARDYVTNRINLLRLLPLEIMRGFLEKALREHGWQRENGTYRKVGEQGEEMVFDLEEMTVTTRLETEEVISKEKTVTARGDALRRSDVSQAKEALRRRVEEQLEKDLRITDQEVAAKEAALQADLAERLAATEEARLRELNRVIKDVYAESLKEKAKTLGTVTHVHEETRRDGQEYQLTIRIAET